MELSGNVKEDLNNLIISYNLYGLKILTTTKDVNNNILKFLNLKDLINFSMINNQIIKSFDDNFWILKFKHDDLPITTEKLNFKNYNFIFEAKNNAKYIIEINRIEMNRDKTNGMIRIYHGSDNILLKNILSVIKNEAIQTIISKINDDQKHLSIAILPLEEDKYRVKFYYDMGDLIHIIILGDLHCNYKMILYILTLIQFNTVKYNIKISDNTGLKFIVNDEFLLWFKNRLPNRYKQDKLLLFKRMGILDSLRYNNFNILK
jgi:hypothetical protein